MKPKFIIVHTSAFKGDVSAETIKGWHVHPRANKNGTFRYLGKTYQTQEELPDNVRDKRGNGWLDIGYHIVIRQNGTIEYGRKYNVAGAHCSNMGMNSKSLGVCFSGHGNFERWTAEQREVFQWWYYTDAYKLFDIVPDNVLGHRETGAIKDCPGTLIEMDHVRRNLYTRFFGTI